MGTGATNNVLVLSKSHYVLMKMHRNERADGMTDHTRRGGMHRSWTWGDEDDDDDDDMHEVPDWAWSTDQEHQGARIVPADGATHVEIGSILED